MSLKVLSVIGLLMVVAAQIHGLVETHEKIENNYLQTEVNAATSFFEVRNKVDDLLNKLKGKIDSAIATAQHALDVAEEKVNETADKIQKAAANQFKTVGDSFIAELEKLKQKAKDASVNIDECLNGNEDRLVNLPNQLSNDMIHCVSDKINEVISRARNTLNNIQAAVDEIANLKRNIKKCGHGFSSIKCLAKLAIEIEKDIILLPKKIMEDANAAVAAITGLGLELPICASQKIDQCKKDGKKILMTITACVAKKL